LRPGADRETLYGPMILLVLGLFRADEPIANWILNDWEDNQTLTSGMGMNIHGLTDDRFWFSQGGMVFQANLQNPIQVYLRRHEIPAAIRTLYNDFTACLYPDVNAFTFSLPVFWAIVLAAPGIRRSLRPLIFGTILVAILEIVLLLIYVEICARNAASQLAPQSGLTKWFLHFGEYLVVSVIPYTAPFPIALCVHRELRSQFFRWGEGTALPGGMRHGLQSGAARNGRPRSKKQRRRDMGPARQS